MSMSVDVDVGVGAGLDAIISSVAARVHGLPARGRGRALDGSASDLRARAIS